MNYKSITYLVWKFSEIDFLYTDMENSTDV